MLLRTAKSCGPDAPTLASSSRSCVGPTGLRQDISAGDGGKTARSPGRARRKPLKPLRAGMPGDSGVLVVTRVRFNNAKCTRGRGCSGHPAFPTPSKGREINARLGRIAPRDREVVSEIGASCRSSSWTGRSAKTRFALDVRASTPLAASKKEVDGRDKPGHNENAQIGMDSSWAEISETGFNQTSSTPTLPTRCG
jgi:hypothetical protein